MGQLFMIANLDKKEFFSPHSLGYGAKLMEMVKDESCPSPSDALLLLLSSDPHALYHHPDEPLIGHWCGDRITVAGESTDFTYVLCVHDEDEKKELLENDGYHVTLPRILEEDILTNISDKVSSMIENVFEGKFYIDEKYGTTNFKYTRDS